jgi:hypothetical protein
MRSKDLTCPYCGHQFDHDGDFEGLDTDHRLDFECEKCEGHFYCYVDFTATYSDAYKID